MQPALQGGGTLPEATHSCRALWGESIYVGAYRSEVHLTEILAFKVPNPGVERQRGSISSTFSGYIRCCEAELPPRSVGKRPQYCHRTP